MMLYHDIEGWPNAARTRVELDVLIVEPGRWRDFGSVDVLVEGVTVQLLPADVWVYLDRQGGLVLSDAFLPYGQDFDGSRHEMLDLLAWKDGEDWHIKRVMTNA